MSILERYQTISLVQDDVMASLYRGQLSPGGRPTLIKELKEKTLNAKSVARLRHDFQILQEHPTAASLKAYALIEQDGNFAICFEAIEGIFLSEVTAKGAIPLKEFFPLAQALVGALALLQAEHIIHKNLSPANILWNKEDNLVKILDFSIATTLAKETPTDVAGSVLEGTLAYMSPEQTGRMNISLDYRSDFYALGVIFYQLLTGRLPFEQTDMLALVHAHLAVMPEAPHTINPSIPVLLSNIVLKLLDKRPDKRYQTATGLLNDLEKAKIVLKDNAATFTLGQQDVNPSLQISSKLYGREESVKTLQEDYASVMAGKKCITLVAGAPGIGKTSLVNELYKPITERAGFFIRGKFDQLQSGTPYSALSQAFANVIRQILLAPEAEVKLWKRQLNAALAPNGQVMVNIIPALELLIGKQAAPPTINITQEETRLNNVIEQFIRAVATEEHPLALFLDDLQWIDPASLKIFQRLFSSDASRWFYFVGAYRDNEVSETHPLMHALGILEKSSVDIHRLKLGPLSEAASAAWLADTLASKPQDVQSLAQLCYRKTAGNPFFLKQFVQALYEDRLLKLDLKKRAWVWDIQQVENKQMTDNVIELMSSKIKSLPPNQIELLKLAACIGNHFNLEMLINITNQSFADLSLTLWELFRSELVLPENEEYKYLNQTEAHNVKCYFLHDRVQEAAYSLMDQHAREKTHLSIGRLLLEHISESERDTHLFDILSHLNRGRNLITDRVEKENLVKLNLQATQKAIQGTAFNVAKNLIAVGLELLGENPWQSDYQTTFNFYEYLALAHLCLSEHDKMQEIAEIGIKYGKTAEDRASFYKLRIGSYTITSNYPAAINTAILSLGELGLKVPKTPHFYHSYINLLKIRWQLRGTKVADLATASPIQDSNIKARVLVLSMAHTGMAIGGGEKFYFPWDISTRTYYLLKYGNAEESPYIYADTAFWLSYNELDIPLAYEFAELARDIVRREPNNPNIIPSLFLYYGFCVPLWASTHDIYAHAVETYQLSKRHTEPVLGQYALSSGLDAFFLSQTRKESLNAVEEECLKYLPAIQTSQDFYSIFIFTETLSAAKFLLGHEPVPAQFLDVEKANSIPVVLLSYIYFMHASTSAFTFEAYEQAEKIIERMTLLNRVFHGKSFGAIVMQYVYISLTYLALYPQASASKKREYLRKVRDNQSRIKKRMQLYKQNFEHYYLLVEAELCRVHGENEKAQHHYSRAIEAADKNDFVWALALCYELAAKYYAGNGLLEIARFHMQEALLIYANWGAIGKVRHLEALYPNLCVSQTSGLITREAATTSMMATSSDALDLSSVMRANQTISGEIQLEKLMEKMLHVIIENAGAEKAVFLEKRRKHWSPLAQVKEDRKEVQFKFYSKNAVPCKFPEKVINFCARAEEPVVLANACEASEFQDDAYIKRYQVKSMLCLPIVHQKKILGLIYLENNLSVGCFTQDRLSILKSLSTQIAISLTNARHFDKMESLYHSTERFVPRAFLDLLNKENIEEIKVGDSAEINVAVMFADIRNFTTIAESMSAEKTAFLLNAYMQRMSPIIRMHHGFVSQFYGDGIMALFPREYADSVDAAIKMRAALPEFNVMIQEKGYDPIAIGIGLHAGPAMLIMLGEKMRMDSSVVSDVVNSSARVEGLNKLYGTGLLFSGTVYDSIKDPENYLIRQIDKVKMKGKKEAVRIYEAMLLYPDEEFSQLREYIDAYENGFSLYEAGDFKASAEAFAACLHKRPNDTVAALLKKRCETFIVSGTPAGWNGIYSALEK